MYRLLALSLAFLIGFNALGVDLNLHFCQGQFSSISIKKSSSCCSAKTQVKRCKMSDAILLEDSQGVDKCCSDLAMEVNPSEDTQSIIDLAVLQDIQWELPFKPINDKVKLTHLTDVQGYNTYRPPLIPKERSLLFQVFLI